MSVRSYVPFDVERMACGVTMTQAEYERVLEARKNGTPLNTHAQLQAFLGHKASSAPNVMRHMIPPDASRTVNGIRPHQALTPEQDALAHKAAAMGAPLPQIVADLTRCFSCDSPLEPKAMRCRQCGALVGT